MLSGGFDFFQRQDPTTDTLRTDDTYGPDRWVILTQTAGIACKRVAGDTLSINAVQLTQNQAAAQRFGLEQILEWADTKKFRSQPAIFQARVKATDSTPIRIAILEWIGTADAVTHDVVNSWTNGTFTAGQFFLGSNLTVTAVGSVTPAAGTWTDISLSATVGASVNNLIVLIWTENTFAQNKVLSVAQAGFYAASTAQLWISRPFAAELALCQRYYEKSYDTDTSPAAAPDPVNGLLIAVAITTGTLSQGLFNFKVTKRITPTIMVFSRHDQASGKMSEYTSAGTYVADRTIGIRAQGQQSFSIYGPGGPFTANNEEQGYWTADAEL